MKRQTKKHSTIIITGTAGTLIQLNSFNIKATGYYAPLDQHFFDKLYQHPGSNGA